MENETKTKHLDNKIEIIMLGIAKLQKKLKPLKQNLLDVDSVIPTDYTDEEHLEDVDCEQK